MAFGVGEAGAAEEGWRGGVGWAGGVADEGDAGGVGFSKAK